MFYEKVSNEWTEMEKPNSLENVKIIKDLEKIKTLDKEAGYCEKLIGKSLFLLSKGNKSNSYDLGVYDRETHEKTKGIAFLNSKKQTYSVYYKGQKCEIPISHVNYSIPPSNW